MNLLIKILLKNPFSIVLILINLFLIAREMQLTLICIYALIFIALRPILYKLIDQKQELAVHNINGKKIFIIILISFLLFYEFFIASKFLLTKENISTTKLLLENYYFFISITTGLISALLLIFSSLMTTKWLFMLSRISADNFYTSKYEKLLINLAIGICINASLFTFVLATLGEPMYIILCYLIISTYFYLSSINIKTKYEYLQTKINQNYTFRIKSKNLIPTLSVIIFIFTFIIIINRSFSYGPDALRTYMHIPASIATNQELPNTQYNTFYPFLVEIFLSPAFFIGDVAAGHIALYLIGSFYLLLIPIILKRLKLSETSLIIAFSPFINFYYFQFKLDIIFTLLTFALFWIYYKFLFEEKVREKTIPLIAILSTTLFIAKLNYIFFILPIALTIIIYLLCGIKKNYRILVFCLIIATIIISPWLFFYSRDIPYTQFLNSKALTYLPDNIASSHNKISNCYYDMIQFEQEYFYKSISIMDGLKDIQKLFFRPLIFFNLIDIGIIFKNIFIIGLFMILKKAIKNTSWKKILLNKKNTGFVILLVSPILISLISSIYQYSLLSWYIAPQIIIIAIYLLKDLENNKLITLVYKFYFPIYAFAFIATSINIPYYSIKTDKKDYGEYYTKNKEQYPVFSDDYEISLGLNMDNKTKIIYTSGATFLNTTYFINNYFKRVLYADYLSVNLKESIYKYKPEYLVVTNYEPVISKGLCTSNYIDEYREQLVKLRKENPNLVTLEKETDSFTLYKVDLKKL